MIYLELFLTFLEIGAVSFGGGYGMISIIREQMFAHGWLTESELLNFIAVAESTPGSLAVNMATFIGASQGGLLGAFLATLSVVLPAFIIILVIAAVISDLLKYAGVNAFLGGIRNIDRRGVGARAGRREGRRRSGTLCRAAVGLPLL